MYQMCSSASRYVVDRKWVWKWSKLDGLRHSSSSRQTKRESTLLPANRTSEGVSQQDHQEQASYLGLNKKKQKKRMGDDPTFFVSWVQN